MPCIFKTEKETIPYLLLYLLNYGEFNLKNRVCYYLANTQFLRSFKCSTDPFRGFVQTTTLEQLQSYGRRRVHTILTNA